MTERSEIAGDGPILVTVVPSAARRVLGAGVLLLLGAILLYLGLASPPAELHWRVFLLALGGACLWLSARLWRATAERLELTAQALRESSGRVVAPVGQITKVERGTFAFKPSNGFMLHLDGPAGGFYWAPGLWWRIGRRVGIGGITPSSETKVLAERLAALVAARGMAD